jgi:thioredoxin 1
MSEDAVYQDAVYQNTVYQHTVYHITGGNSELLSVAQLHQRDVILLDFHAQWCGPCRRIAPLLSKLQQKHSSADRKLILVKVDVDEPGNADLVSESQYNVKSMPTFVWITGMHVRDRLSGADSKAVTAITEKLFS